MSKKRKSNKNNKFQKQIFTVYQECEMAHVAIPELFFEATSYYFYPETQDIESKIEELYENVCAFSLVATDDEVKACYIKMYGSLSLFLSVAQLTEALIAIHPLRNKEKVSAKVAEAYAEFVTHYNSKVVERLSEAATLYNQAIKVKNDIQETRKHKYSLACKDNPGIVEKLISVQKKLVQQEKEGEQELKRLEKTIYAAKFDKTSEHYLLMIVKLVMETFEHDLQIQKIVENGTH